MNRSGSCGTITMVIVMVNASTFRVKNHAVAGSKPKDLQVTDCRPAEKMNVQGGDLYGII